MSKFNHAVELCKKQMKDCRIPCDEKLLLRVCKSIGPALYSRDAALVAASDKKELKTIEKNFVEKKLGVKGPAAEKAIHHAAAKMGSSNRHKKRAVFYYLIIKKLKKDAAFARKHKLPA